MTESMFLRVLREQLNASIESDPRVLLETDDGPEGIKADLYLANLYDHEDRLVAEWIIERAQSVLYMPIPYRPALTLEPSEARDTIRTARYELQSSFAEMKLDWLLYRDRLPATVRPAHGDYLVSVVLLRYRRKLTP